MRCTVLVFLCASVVLVTTFIVAQILHSRCEGTQVISRCPPTVTCPTEVSTEKPNVTSKEKENLFFLKAHKCASSTIQNILMRFGYNRHLDFVLPEKGNYIGNPEPFSPLLIPQSLQSEDNKYNIFTHHTRYNHSGVKSVMYPDAKFVTILRNPANLYESLFNFYHVEKLTKVTFDEVLNTQGKEAELNKRLLGRIGLNQMAWDLGYPDVTLYTKNTIIRFIEKIEAEFDLVMISEHMEASLVLLCDLMNWPLSNVAFLTLNSRPTSKINVLTKPQREKLLFLNQIDAQLYGHFYGKFREKVMTYGKDRMTADVSQLLKLNAEMWRRCVDKPNFKGYAQTTNYDIRNLLDFDCFYGTKTELSFTEELRNSQMRRYKAIKKLHVLLEDT